MDMSVGSTIHLLQQENIRLKEENDHLKEEVSAFESYIRGISSLYKATSTIATQDNLYKLLDEILYQALTVVDTDHGSLLLLDEESHELVFVLVHGEFRDSLQGYRMDWHEGIAGWVVEHGKPLVVNQANMDPRFSPDVDNTFGMHTQDILAVPLKFGDRTMGVLELVNKRHEQTFTDSDAMILSLLANFAAMALAHLEEILEIKDGVEK